MWTGGGEVLVDALDRQLPPSVDLHLGTPAVGLVFEGARVVGVETADGMIEAGWVIIASGGFVNRADLVARFTRAPAGSWGVGADGGAWGSAIGWAQEYGLGIADPGAIGWNANVLGVPGADGTPVKADRATSSPMNSFPACATTTPASSPWPTPDPTPTARSSSSP